jgi:hypothetical protein
MLAANRHRRVTVKTGGELVRIEELFLEPEVLHEQRAVQGEAVQVTQLCRSRLEPGGFVIRQTTRWDDGTTTEGRVYFGSESLANMAEAMKGKVG